MRLHNLGTNLRIAGYAGFITVVCLLGGCGSASQPSIKPFNRIVLLIDTSSTMMKPNNALEGKVPFEESLRMVQEFLLRTAERKDRRWDISDDFHIVAIDANSQEIWRGDRKALLQLTPEQLTTKLDTRRQFAGCTDIGKAFGEAAMILEAQPQPSGKFLLTFSDLVNEPPTRSFNQCAAASGEPPEFNWSRLANVSLAFYWVSSDFRYRPDRHWKDRLSQAGLILPSFFDAAQTVSSGVELTPPPKAKLVLTEDEKNEAKESVRGLTSVAIKIVGGFFILLVFVPICLISISFLLKRQRANHIRT